jgi:hypothetical protein
LTRPMTRRWRAAKAETMWIGALALLLVEAARGLAVDGDHLGRCAGKVVTQATKQRRNASASGVANISPRWSCDGVPSPNGQNRRSSSSFFSPNRAMSTKLSAPASTANSDSSSTSSNGLRHLAALTRVRQIAENAREKQPSLRIHHTPLPPLPSPSPANRTRRTTTDSALCPFVTYFLHPIA